MHPSYEAERRGIADEGTRAERAGVPVPSAARTAAATRPAVVDPAPVPRDTDYASVFVSDQPIVVQHTRLDSRRAEIALMSTMAFAQS